MNEQEQEHYRQSIREYFIKRENIEAQNRKAIEKRIFHEEYQAHLERLKEFGTTNTIKEETAQ